MNPLTELENLTGLFPSPEPLIRRAEHLPSALVPEPYKQLLVHDHHMTVTMEAFYGTRMTVTVLDRRLEGDAYCRKIVLKRADTGEVVQFGLVRFDFQYVIPAVRQGILAENIPLGRVLINHNVFRHIDLGAIVKLLPGTELAQLLNCTEETWLYGRLATIFCDGKPAVDLLEIAAPV